jgi:hypothetical protein
VKQGVRSVKGKDDAHTHGDHLHVARSHAQGGHEKVEANAQDLEDGEEQDGEELCPVKQRSKARMFPCSLLLVCKAT